MGKTVKLVLVRGTVVLVSASIYVGSRRVLLNPLAFSKVILCLILGGKYCNYENLLQS